MKGNIESNFRKRKICFIVTIFSIADAFLRDHIDALSEYFDIYLVANFTESDMNRVETMKLKGFKNIAIERNISLLNDLKSVAELKKYFRESEFYSVHSVSPKAGLLVSIAGIFARVPNRIHIFTGQVWATKKGLLRFLLMSIDWLIAKLNTLILIDGESQRNFLISKGIISEKSSIVIGDGSIAGVNTARFHPEKAIREEIRNELKISSNKIVYVFLGRLNKDKGIDELLLAFNILSKENNDVYLLLIGVDEDNYISKLDEFDNIQPNINFHYYGKTTVPEKVLQAGDVFCLPTYREGFGMSVIEASCLGLPVICSDTYGVMDAMLDDITGLRCKVKDMNSLYERMKRLSTDSNLRHRLGMNGRERVLKRFSGKFITKEWVKLYLNLKKTKQ